MVTFAVLLAVLLVVAIIIAAVLLLGGASVIVVLGDLLVFAGICWIVFKLFRRFRK